MGEKRKRQSSPSVSNVRGVTGSEMGTCIIDGENLSSFLELLGREIELGKLSRGAAPEKIWMKQQFSIGVNDTTRVLERMPRAKDIPECSMPSESKNESSVQLQALLVASDCGSKWLIKHFPSLAYSRGVPLISIADNKAGSLRLGEVVKLKTAIAIGANGSGINKFVTNFLERRCLTGQGGE
ncbi:uncharacterized protein LOC116262075 isoform X3 [Nymphaea colorata]|uniref:uncharacterized protein LOC116262075 isoform X3 n=1 Tax=Nymphaea colorata TaxID=210225 RepID=UPI00129DAEFB|nr:uncharacterized protein LOC116262075 isoform X3 [Nymphaea colorata]